MLKNHLFILVILFAVLFIGGCFSEEDSVDGDGTPSDGDNSSADGDTDGVQSSADFTWNVSPSTLSVYFESAHDSYDSSGTVTFSWDFGDGETGDQHSLNHEYAKPGDYTVSLEVEFDDGQKFSSSQDINITGYGVVKWKFLLEDDEGGLEASDRSLALASDGTIYALVTPIGGARIIYSIAPDGTRNWKFTDFDYPRPGGCADPIFSEITKTVYIVCNTYPEPFPDVQTWITYVTAISASGQKKWMTIVPNDQMVPNLAITLNTSEDYLSDKLYLAANSTPLSEEQLPSTIYELNQTGSISKSSYKSDENIIGLGFGAADNLYVVKQNGTLEVLSSSLASLWTYKQQAETTLRGYMAFDANGRVFLPLTTPSGLQALQFDVDSQSRLLWTYPTLDYPGPPTVTADGKIAVVERGVGITLLEPADGSVIWEMSQYATTGVLGIAALEDGTLIAEMQNAQILLSSDGERLGWGPPAIVTSVATVAQDGTFYIFGHRDHDTVYDDAIYAIYGSAPLSKVWTRHRADNANTARLLSATKD